MSGPPPKAPNQRRRRNVAAGSRVISAEIVPSPIHLPDDLSSTLHPLTMVFWREITQSPMANEWDPSDLHGLFLLADLINSYWNCDPTKLATKAQLAAEIRLQEQRFGLSPLDRRRLQWEIERSEQAQDAGTRRRKSNRPDPRDEFPSPQ